MQGHLHERLPVRGMSDELDKLAVAVNGMLGDIRGVGDSMAHDLRTPGRCPTGSSLPGMDARRKRPAGRPPSRR